MGDTPSFLGLFRLMKIRPRRLYWSSVLSVFAILLTLGGVSHYYAQRIQRRAIERRLDALELSIHQSKDVRAVDRPPVVGNESQRDESVAGLPNASVCRPRVLGTGQNKTYRYADYRLPDGSVKRYYVRKTATKMELKQFLDTLKADTLDALDGYKEPILEPETL